MSGKATHNRIYAYFDTDELPPSWGPGIGRDMPAWPEGERDPDAYARIASIEAEADYRNLSDPDGGPWTPCPLAERLFWFAGSAVVAGLAAWLGLMVATWGRC